ncbi:PREDICTED: protein FAM179B [Tinamus guttatus]|uniref:protein FAM179B n=1 Tax=Tinamus guttatus TaxID=94827 RepID=UPI00052EEDB5|nr:PREDICTED: protein FAM179B [Tinamus guttatus]
MNLKRGLEEQPRGFNSVVTSRCLLSPPSDFLQSPKLRPSQGMPVSDELFFSRKRPSRNLFQNRVDLSSEHSSVCPAGAVGSHQPHISGKCGQLGYTQINGKSGSVDSELQFLGLNNGQQEKGPPRGLRCPSRTVLGSSRALRPGERQQHEALGLPLGKGFPCLALCPARGPGGRAGPRPRADERPSVSVRASRGRSRHEGSVGACVSIRSLRQAGSKCSSRELLGSLLKLMQSSLRSLRNSAAKKRAQLSSSVSDLESPDSARRLRVSGGSRASSPSASSCSESSLCSQEPPRRRVMSDTFPLLGNKSQPPRISSARSRETNVTEHTSSTGLMLHDKGTSNVSIVGQRLRCGNGCDDSEDKKQSEVSPTILKSQNTEHQRNFKHSKGFTGSTSSFQQINSLDFMSPRVLPEASVAVVGKGVFGSSSALPCSPAAPREEKGAEQAARAGAVCRSSAAPPHAASDGGIKVAMSKSAQDKMRQKKKEQKEQNHKVQHEVKDLEVKEENPWAKLKLKEPEKMTIENEASLGARGQYKERTPSVTHSPEIMDPSELQPFSRPETALAEALRLLADDDWEKKIEGLNFVRCLSAYHADILTVKLHETSLAVAQEVKNLRSGVSRAAVVCLGDLFTYLKKNMDQELDNTVKVLLHKAGESNTFIREDVDKALKAMVNNVTPARALCSLINGGQSHLHTAVRRCTAQHLSDVVERMGPARILCGTKDVTDRVLAATARFAQDGSQETRYYGRKMLFSMMTHPDFDKMLEKCVPAKDLPYIKESVNNLRQKGLGEMPLDTPSAKGRRSHTSSVGHSRSSSTSRDALNVTERESVEAREVQRKTVPHNSLETVEYVKVITDLLNAKDFRDRINGIKQLLSDTENNQDLVVANIVKIFDAFKSRLHDSNSKVNQVALETMHKMIPLLKDNLSPVINMLIPAMVDNNLNSKNPGIYAAVTNVIQALCQHLDNYLLLQPFCTKAQFLNGKAKQDMTEKLADLVTELYPRKPHAVEQKVLVVLWHLLGSTAASGSLCGAGGDIPGYSTANQL